MRKFAGTARVGHKGLGLVTAILSLSAIGAFAAPVSADLPDGRQYEIVSTTDGARPEGVVIAPFGRPAADGNAMAFQVYGNLANGSSSFRNTYVSTRAADKWTAKLVSPSAKTPPPGICPDGFGGGTPSPLGCPVVDNPFGAFSADLSKGIFGNLSPFNVSLVPGEPLNKFNFYVRDIPSGTNTLLTDADSAPARRGLGDIGGMSDDGTVAAFDGADGPNVWTAENGVTQVSSLSYAFAVKIGAGHTNRTTDEEYAGSDEFYGGQYHALSPDGSRLYATVRSGSEEYPSGTIYVYKDPGTPGMVEQTLKIGTQPVGGYFRDSSADGHKAIFTSCTGYGPNSTADYNGFTNCRTDSYNTGTEEVCTTDPGDDPNDPGDDVTTCEDVEIPYAHNDLYLWDEDANGGTGGVTDLTTQDQTNGARVLGVLGASRDLNRVYVVAAGDLDGAGPGTLGEPNIYLLDSTSGGVVVTYVAKAFKDPSGTPGGDGNVTHRKEPRTDDIQLWWYPMGDIKHEARVSDDGSVLTFASHARIDPGYDYGAANSIPHKEVYVWKVGDPAATCVSCEGDGPSSMDSTLGVSDDGIDSQSNEPVNGQVSYPDWYPNNVTADGSKVFFIRGNQLSEYDTASGTIADLSGGGAGVQFLGATSSGSDVFFRTTEALLPQHDRNGGGYDVYDARIGGGQPAPPPDDNGEGEGGCKGSTCPQDHTGPGPLTPLPDDSVKPPAKKKFTGLRARALRKCKRVKVKKRKRRCVKAARKKPL